MSADFCNFQCDPTTWIDFALAVAVMAGAVAVFGAGLFAIWCGVKVVEWVKSSRGHGGTVALKEK